ncbi:MAG: DNA cytosine methyltransferase [Bacillota bacterium]
MKKLRVVDIFSGVGGLSQGFISKNFNIELAIENDKEIAYSYNLNHPGTKVLNEDISNINFEQISKKLPSIDVVIGGPPCQGFSQKGQRLSIKDKRNYLFQKFINAVIFLKPSYFVLENVPNILTTAKGFFKKEIIEGFEKIGYQVNSEILNASDFGIPQNRKRAFFIGSLNGNIINFPSYEEKRVTIKDSIYDLPFINSGEGKNFYDYQKPAFSEYQKKLRIGSSGIHNHIATNHSKLAIERLKLIPKGKGREVLPKHHRTKSIYSGTWSRLIENDIAATITTRFDTPSSGLFTHPILDRCLTVREAARIQSFPDKFIFHGSKSSQMKQVGNAVPPLLAEKIAEKILEDINK